MPSAKDNFISKISFFKATLNEPVLISRPPIEVEHNEKARLLRNGLAIVGFIILEDFIKSRLGEAFNEIGATGVAFLHLPKKLREASTLGALNSIIERATNLKRADEDWLTFIQTQTALIAGTSGMPYNLSEFSLGWDKSNLAVDDIPAFLKTFNVDGGWKAIQELINRSKLTLLGPDAFFGNSAQRRHRAAHDPKADSALPDLQGFCKDVKTFALAFDNLISRSLIYIYEQNNDFLNLILKTKANQIEFRFIINENGVWKEYVGNGTRAYRVNDNYDVLFPDAYMRASLNEQVLLVKDERNEVINWYITNL